jgi:3-deoxy-D-manno-octulosonate 8-phosphate phosphatase (KDO 8-P phosphatase)
MSISNLVIDVDGVLTDGKMYYSRFGKVLKSFGPDDADSLKIISTKLSIQFVSADKRGFSISRKRVVRDMGFPLSLISTQKRKKWMEDNYDLATVAYVGDSIRDIEIFKIVSLSFCPKNGDDHARREASYQLNAKGGNRAVSEVCVILNSILNLNLDFPEIKVEEYDRINKLY